MIRLKGGSYLSEGEGFVENEICMDGGTIVSVGAPPEHIGEDTVIDVSGCRVIPGLIDIHTHGAVGYDVMTASAEQIVELSRFYAKNGVTAFMPTTITASLPDILSAIGNIRAAAASENLAANIEGVHIEGPYINAKHKGCHDPSLIRLPETAEIDAIREALGSELKLRVTVAPELDGAMEIIRHIVHGGGYVAIGHCDADAKTCGEAVACGANSFTHLFNAMRGIHHREPGSAGAGLLSGAYAELICDGLHLNPDIVSRVYRVKGIDGILAVTDSMLATGLDDGAYVFGGMDVQVRAGAARTLDGTLAGSTLILKRGVENFAAFAHIPFERALRAATINAARAVGIDTITGSIVPGKRADLVVLDGDTVLYTFCRGKKAYDRFQESAGL